MKRENRALSQNNKTYTAQDIRDIIKDTEFERIMNQVLDVALESGGRSIEVKAMHPATVQRLEQIGYVVTKYDYYDMTVSWAERQETK